jgi:3',5'-cyclic AMP phosphodiesterase CpdA
MKTTLEKSLGFIWCILFIIVLLITKTSCNKNVFPATIRDTTIAGIDSLSFIVIGDWGIKGAEAQKPVADQMNIYGKKHNAQFIITTGDNFYPVGVFSITDLHWKESFEDIYNKEVHQLPWYPVLGNHDYGLNPQAEIQYSSISNRWKMPSRYYSVKKNIGSTNSVMIAFTDTSPFVTGYYGAAMADLQQQDTAAQLSWLKSTLSASTDTWKIVVGHHPVYSVGSHGNTNELIARFKPLFLATQTNFYLCGHDHNLQHIVLPNESIQYLVSGGAGYTSSYPVYPNANTLYAKSTPGFIIMVIYAGSANIYFYNHLGELLYRQQVKK